MPLIDTITRALGFERRDSLDNPAIPLNSPANWQWMFGGEPTTAGEIINENNALTVSTVYACVRTIAESVASLPLELYERTDTGHQKATDAPLYYLLGVEPNPEMSAFTFKETLAGCLALCGNCYAQVERNKAGQVVALWPLDPRKTEPIRQGNVLAYKTSDGMASGTYRIVNAADMLHVPLFSFDGLKGISPIAAARNALGLAKAAEKFGSRFFGGGSRPSGLLLNKGPKPDPKIQQQLRESWQQEQGGVNQGKIGFLFGSEWSYQQVGLSPEDSQFLATRTFQRADIAAIFRIPPHMVGDTSRLSGNNAEQQSLQFVTDTLRPYLSRLESEIVRKLMPTQGRKANKYFVSFDVSERLRGDFKTQMDGFASGRQWGWFTGNNVLRKLGENPGGPELDIYLVPVNMQNAKRLLDTESIQDQPIDADPSAPTDAERSALNTLTEAYILLFRDAFGRASTRNKRDFDSLSACFRPVLTSICEEVERQAGLKFDLNDHWNDCQERTLRDVVKSMEKRAGDWTEDKSTEFAGIEFNKAVRAIVLNVYRDAGAAVALKEAA